MSFHKFSSISNTSDKKELGFFLERYPILSDKKTRFIEWEKIDGSNLQLIFERGKDNFVLGSRNETKSESSDHYGSRAILSTERFQQFKEMVLQFISRDENIESLNIYGEVFGTPVINRIDYGTQRRILFYAMKINGIFVTPLYFIEYFMGKYGFSDLLCPYKIKENLAEILEEDVETESVLLCDGAKRRIKEGVVIAPYDENIVTSVGNRFIFKKKSKAFKEKEGSKISKGPVQFGDLTIILNNKFLEYINENRMIGMFSKVGRKIESNKEIGFWVKEILQDAKEEFEKDFEEEIKLVNIKERKHIFNAGSKIANLLQKSLVK